LKLLQLIYHSWVIAYALFESMPNAAD